MSTFWHFADHQTRAYSSPRIGHKAYCWNCLRACSGEFLMFELLTAICLYMRLVLYTSRSPFFCACMNSFIPYSEQMKAWKKKQISCNCSAKKRWLAFPLSILSSYILPTCGAVEGLFSWMFTAAKIVRYLDWHNSTLEDVIMKFFSGIGRVLCMFTGMQAESSLLQMCRYYWNPLNFAFFFCL